MSRDEVLTVARSLATAGSPPTMDELAAAANISLRTLYRLFGSRQALLQELDQAPPATARQRILEAALERIGRQGLVDLSIGELAEDANVSRATLYRIFPGKRALFTELIQTFSPLEAVADAIQAAPDAAPEVLVRQIGHAIADAMAGRTGLLLRIVLEMTKGTPDVDESVVHSLGRGMADLVRYLEAQMAAGRLRRMHPILAFQLLAGPIVAHLLTLPLARMIGFEEPQHEVVNEIVDAWLRAMAVGENR